MQGCGNVSGAGIALRVWLLCLLAFWRACAAESVAPTQTSGELVLVDFMRGFDQSKVAAQGTTLSETKSSSGTALRVRAGQNESWPGVKLPAVGSNWDLSRFAHIAVSITNPGTNELHVSCRVDNPGADGSEHCVTASVAVGPGKPATLRVALKRSGEGKLNGQLFGMRGYPSAPGGPGTVNASNISQVVVFLTKAKAGETFDLLEGRAGGCYTPPTASVTDAEPFFPLIDTFGQYRHRDWPGKVYSLAELRQRAEQERSALTPAVQDWDQYGGWASGPLLKGTGFFRVEKYRGKWWLVDPLGRLFWSHGIDCVRSMDLTPIEERESWFESFPGGLSDGRELMVEHVRPLKGHYAGRSVRAFSFASANLARKYGPQWREVFPEVIHERLRSWGLNTIANWSDETTRLMRRTPYTDAISSGRTAMIEGSEGYWGKFPDPFAPGFKDSLRRSMAGKKSTSAGDPWCLGFFSDNEMSWGDDTSLAMAALGSPPEQPAKKKFVADLKTYYAEIATLNEIWGTKHISWEALLAQRAAPDKGDRKRTR